MPSLRRIVALGCFLLRSFALPAAARAEPPEDSSERTHVLAADAAGLALVGSSLAVGPSSDFRNGLFIAGLSTLTAGGPLVHAAHDHGGLALQSAAFRIGGPLGGAGLAFLGYEVVCNVFVHPPDFRVNLDERAGEESHHGRCSAGGQFAVGGAAVGLLAAILVDELVLSKPKPVAPAPALSVSLRPVANGAMFGVGGTLP